MQIQSKTKPTGTWEMWILWEEIIPGCDLIMRENTGSLYRKQVQVLAGLNWDENHSSLETTEKDTDQHL